MFSLINLFITRIFSFLFSRALWSFLGLVILSCLIWFLGPALRVGEFAPLESRDVRMYLIIAIFALYFLRLFWRKYREGRFNAKLLGQLKSKKPKDNEKLTEKEREEVRVLSERFDEAIALLKQSRFENGKDKSLSARFSKQYLYQLPWYVFIGAPGSGKTTALVNSGLNFPLAEKFGRMALKGVGGTRNCDWWFTDEAVLLDTAGRYTTQDSNTATDEDEWKGFLKLLTKYRARQPINGVMLTVSVYDLLASTQEERAKHAVALKKRLQELRDELGTEFPVYILVTKMDQLHGFEDYFDNLSVEEHQQVWGFTFPYEESQEEGFSFYDSYEKEFQILQERLFDGLPDLLMKNRNLESSSLAYLLPQQFANLRIVLGTFLTEVFSFSRLESKIVPRGVYFTSGTQGGVSFDKVSEDLKDYLQIDGISQHNKAPVLEGGKSYFLTDLLQNLIFKESGLAGVNLKWEKRYRQMQWIGYGLVGLLLLGALTLWFNSYRNNTRYLDFVEEKLPVLQNHSNNIKISESGDVFSILPYLSLVKKLPNGETFNVEDAPFSYGFGLYQGGKIKSASRSIYDEAIHQVFAPQIAKRIEKRLATMSDANIVVYYEALRAYLMMYEPEHYDKDYFMQWVLHDVVADKSAQFNNEQFQLLREHMDYLFGQGAFVSPFPLNEELVQLARDRIDAHDLAERAYNRAREILKQDSKYDVSLMNLAGVQASTVFRRKSGDALNKGVNRIFSYEGYWNNFNKNIEKIAIQLREDDEWVLGINNTKFADGSANKLVNDVKKLYFVDYIREWDAFLADVEVIPPKNLSHAIELSRSMSSSNSPLTKFVKGVAADTTLLREDVDFQRTLVDRATESASSMASSLTSLMGPLDTGDLIKGKEEPEKLESMVDNHFIDYHELAVSAGNNQDAPIEGTIDLIEELYNFLTASETALRTKVTLPSQDVISKLQAESGRLPPVVGNMLTSITAEASKAINSGAQANIGADINAQIGMSCRNSITNRYPFRSTTRDVAPNDFARFFAPNGLMDQFFNKHLINMVDMSKHPWRFKPGVDGSKGNIAKYLSSFEKASVIRDVYFAGGKPEPSFKVSIRPVEMDASITQMVLNIDGQTLTYEHGPQIGKSFDWPGQGSNQVSITLSPIDGTSSLTTNGPWALNRLIDNAKIKNGRSPEVIFATFNIGGRSVKLEITANSAKSPFRLGEMRSFTCPGVN
ncbi:type VI secretion system membrane subunit TssM [Taylorella equigenitalis]|uniref:type VI secretion system membrane subunit TssM n=1 Tax=Taylorella equigenitalis TaxID=29575 RepID=UPI000DD98036|nr:type VI secretion system membrane subunit TssM [Taylorella equigenitalis]RBA27125.1 type VI secretion system membrane subunit TssM [Taylorella equigenitalis]